MINKIILQFSVFSFYIDSFTTLSRMTFLLYLFVKKWLNFFLGFEQSIDALETTDTAINIELTVLGNRLSELSTTVIGLDGRVAQFEVSGIFL